ncbi:MAG: dual specificity protein phosphatase family protein [Phycisphaeraceae bacterium]|nr:dual specificity protein phosphatase family protein [Phycisphaeraceae bacterium]
MRSFHPWLPVHLVLTSILGACATTGRIAHTPESVATAGLNTAPIEQPVKMDADAEGYTANAFRVGPVIVAGQPTEATLQRLAKDGCTLVVNIRTPEEMNDRQRVPFDEAETLKRLNIEYVFIPLGGPNREFAYTTDATDKFAAALARHQSGPVLLHCQVGYRATHLWAAYLVRTRGMTPDEAIAIGSQMVMSPQPFDGLAGLKSEYLPVPTASN